MVVLIVLSERAHKPGVDHGCCRGVNLEGGRLKSDSKGKALLGRAASRRASRAPCRGLTAASSYN